MELLIRVILAIIGLLNFLPSLGIFSKSKLEDTYGIKIEDRTLELLLKHRAFLFGIIGGFIIYSSVSGTHYFSSLVLGMLSMISFILFAKLIPESNNPNIKKIILADWIGIILGIILFIFLYQ